MLSMDVERLQVRIFDSTDDLGQAAAAAVSRCLQELDQKQINMVFAAAPSQNAFLEHLTADPAINWEQVQAFHLDEYIGLPPDSPQRFRVYLDEHVFGKVPLAAVHYLGAGDPETECRRYSGLLVDHPLDIACIGIGENGHLAFNDPPVADFFDPLLVKTVELDRICREQQVHDGCFPTLDAVPTHALTMTIPAILSARYIFCIVPGKNKAQAVRAALRDELSTACPASILRRHIRAQLFLDSQAAADL